MDNKTLVNILVELFSYQAELQKKFTMDEITTKVADYLTKYDEEIGKNADELKNLIKALDELDFKQDGVIDVKALTKAVAENQAEVMNIKDSIQSLKDNGVDLTEVYSKIDNNAKKINDLTAVVEGLQASIDDIKAKLDEVYAKSSEEGTEGTEETSEDNNEGTVLGSK